jgi:hypothetical protein
VPERGIELELELDDAADHAPEHRLELGDHTVERQHAGLEYLAPAERQQLSRESRRALAGVPDLLDVSPQRVIGAKLLEQQLAVAQDPGEQVVEVVRDAAGKLADRFHLLGVAQLLLAPPEGRFTRTLLGDVLGECDGAEDLA